jgi:hypothetical protein
MVKATNFGELDYVAFLGPLDGPGLRSIARQRQMTTRSVVVLEVARQDPAEMCLGTIT